MFDLSIVEKLKQDVGTELFPKLYQVFGNESAQLGEQIMTVSELDTETERLCHSLKSSARTYGATELAAFAETLESLAKAKNESFFAERSGLGLVVSQTISSLPTD